ncbi:hypothetical protein [Haloarcula marismortui]|uniref:Uncharacterized protein n=1 Tax=Haloarcula marismortui ATCC 33800 TaxID=662476 RepID=A0A8T8KI80_9EURY|nr:hypothetical protein [Haloarcula sinaiiensis]QUJ74021.1 hypothetical protein KDQ40_18810 [Haloarcula sinaiiensis ATCC 33800]
MTPPLHLTEAQNGRIPCDNCRSRNTEIIRTSLDGNTHEVECHDCGHEQTTHSGPKCPGCGGHNTTKTTVGTAPHRRRGVSCQDCGRTPR